MAAGDLVGRDACSLAAENGIENVEKHVKAALLERRRREAGRQAHGRGARQTPIEPLHCGLTQIDRLVAHDHIGKRAAFERIADPKPMRPVDVAQDQMTAGGEHAVGRSEEHTSELQSLMRISYAGFCLKKKKQKTYGT